MNIKKKSHTYINMKKIAHLDADRVSDLRNSTVYFVSRIKDALS